MKQIEVVAGIIINQDKILCMKRGISKFTYVSQKFEFPGGKVEDKETYRQALAREIREELRIEIEIGEKLMVVNHTYPDFQIRMHCYLCSSENRKITLTEHIESKWLYCQELNQLDWAAADIPAVKRLMECKNAPAT
ncbi:(deoxy)nucleoside triphosphate pyrophosphohydrolase [Desulfotalea psychrophila]|uniref:8-oxo-dGTP diphosphatase n=1 Tax=Desulfotalea psychrophila (strain LSv54 / DSM 12343) TaxID=177439 RepID=Q6AK76_DESPS|nr:(deoxy)nucleoside triphosphate pyrophosphohydrolase [Desulfotalea psychrophila]CAG37250.1 related to 7,8-dihydro-8-oxoguanine-triphosphatase [Desulfotalea psychrophila LSv54]